MQANAVTPAYVAAAVPTPWLAIATAAVAGAAFVFTVVQGIWQRDLARRQYDVSVRQVQHGLLDRRLAILSVLTEVLANVSFYLPLSDDLRTRFFNNLLAGQTVFGTAIAAELDAIWLELIRYLNEKVEENAADPKRYREAQQAKREKDEAMRQRLASLRKTMIDASRIEAEPRRRSWPYFRRPEL